MVIPALSLWPEAIYLCKNDGEILEINVKLSNTLFGIGLGLAAGHAPALSLGNAQGRVVLGQPIDLVFEVRTDSGVGLDAACLAADALQGETKIDSTRLRLVLQPAGAGQVPTVRVRSSVVVNEPVLTVRLSAGCSGAIARTYHFFAEMPASVAAGTAPVAIPSFKPLPAVAPAGDPERNAPQGAAPAAAPRRATTPVAETPRKAVASGKPAARSAARAPAPVAALPSRLVVEPLGHWLDSGEPTPLPLRLSAQLAAPAQEGTDAQRAEATALWKALNTPVSEVQAANERLRQQQAEAAAARTRAAAAQATAAELEQRLARDQDERFSASVVYALVALLAAALAVLGLLWSRARTQAQRAEQAWRGLVASSASAPETDFAASVAPQPLPAAAPEPAPRAAEPAPGAPSGADLSPDMAAEDAHGAWPPTAASAPAAPAEVVNPEDLFDLQQQAEFFVSVGEHDQAIDVMKRHIADNERSSPLAYLELLRLYHSLSRVGDFNTLREQFHRYFNAQIPEFTAFHRASRTLLDWPEALAQIEALWSDAAVLALLEGLLFCHEGTDTARFDLAAYDDLLLLYAIARTTPPSARGAPPPRARTTPLAAPELPPAPEPPTLTPQAVAALFEPADSGNLMEYDLELVSDSSYAALGLDTPAAAPAALAPSLDMDLDLDLDLTEPAGVDDWALPPLTVSELPAMPVTPPPQPEQPRGFGANSDRVEARFDLEERKPG